MEIRPLKKIGGLLAAALMAFVIVGCRGADGRDGTDGTNGTDGTDGTPGVATVVDAATMSPEQWAALKPQGRITGVTMGGAPVVNFEIKDHLGNGIKGLGFTSQGPDRSGNIPTSPALTNLSFAVAKWVPEDATTKAPSKWVSYMVTTMPATKASDGSAVPMAPTRPTTDNTGTLVDNGNGTYQYTFYRNIATTQAFLDGYSYSGTKVKADLGDVTYNPNLTHRITIQFSGAARGTGSNTPTGTTVATAVNLENPINVVYDFVPATGAVSPAVREIGNIGKCNECHDKLAFHGGGRVELKYCVVCHTDQRKYDRAAATTTSTGYSGSTYRFANFAAGDMAPMVHLIHMGKELSKDGYDYAGVKFDKLGYSMLGGGQRMCAKCHSGSSTDAKATAQGENWNLKPTRMACGSCHDGVDFSAAHAGQIRTDDSTCAICHNPAEIKAAHYTDNITAHNPSIRLGLTTFTYQVASVTQATSGGQVDIKFRILASTDGSTPAPVQFVSPAATVSNALQGFTGAPSFLMAYALPQDGVAAPVDYNNLGSRNVTGANAGQPISNFQPMSFSIANLLSTNLSTSVGTLEGPDGSGYYTAKVVGANAVFPAGAKLRTVALQGYFTQVAGTWDSNHDGAINTLDTQTMARHTISASKAVSTAETRRRVIDSAKCANCHEWFEGHGGNRVYDVQVCVTCHVPGLTTSGRGVSDTVMSGLSEEQVATLAEWGVDNTAPNAALSLPQISNNMKDMIHGIHMGKERETPFRDARDFRGVVLLDAGEIGYPGRLTNCQSCHTYDGYSGVPANTLASRQEADNGVFLNGTSRTPADAKAALVTANDLDLMTTPFTASCVSCHDTAPAKAHMVLNGGQILVPRAVLNNAGESCAVCHGAGAAYDSAKVHK